MKHYLAANQVKIREQKRKWMAADRQAHPEWHRKASMAAGLAAASRKREKDQQARIQKLSDPGYQDSLLEAARKRLESIRASRRRWHLANLARELEASKRWKKDNPKKIKEQKQRWKKENTERVKEMERKWKAANLDKRRVYEAKRRAKIKVGLVSPNIIKVLWLKQAGRCANTLCSADLSLTVYHLDHKMPLALGGAHEDDNFQLLCVDCNQSKGAKHPDDWAKEQETMFKR